VVVAVVEIQVVTVVQERSLQLMGNPYELDYLGAVKTGFDIGQSIQERRDRQRVQQMQSADRVARLELDRQVENRRRESELNNERQRLAMETAALERHAAGAQYTADVYDLVNQDPQRDPLRAHVIAVERNPKAPQAQISLINIMPSKPKPPTTVTDLPGGAKIIEGPGKYIAPPKAVAGPVDVNDVQEFVFNSSGMPFMKDEKGRLITPPGAEKIRADYLKDQKTLETEKARLKKMETAKPGFWGGKPSPQLMDATRAKIEEIENRYPNRKGSKAAPANADKKKITRDEARKLFEKAGRDKVKYRQLVEEAGFEF
jgi:hypothetical protein